MSIIFSFPQLHREFAVRPLPPHVAFMNPGLEVGQRALSPAEKAFCAPLPIPPAQSAAALEEMLTLGETLPRPSRPYPEQTPNALPSSLPADERNALEAFSRTGESPETEERLSPASWMTPRPTDEQIRRELVACQKTLLLAWALEERAHEIRTLRDAVQGKEQSLRVALGEGKDAPAPNMATSPFADTPEESGPWRMILDAALPFLPPRALLFTDDTVVAGDLREAGMLQPLPEDKGMACRDWPQELTAGLLWVRLPAWRLVGRRGPLAERPWLEREVEMLVARPVAGWEAVARSVTGETPSSGKKAGIR